MNENPVVIVGAGPTGMAAAAMLARYGVASILFEREPDVVPIPRAVHLDEEVVRALHWCCLGDEASRELRPIRGMQLVDRDLHTLVSFAREGDGPHGFPRSNAFDQPELERAMRHALAREPLVTLRSSTSVEAIEHLRDGGLRVTYHDQQRDALGELEAPVVLACDGARSRTRAFVGTDFEDLGFEARWLVVDVHTDAQLGLYDGCLQVADPERPTTYFCTGGGRHRWEIMLRDGETRAEMTRESNVRDLLRPWLREATESATLRRRAVYTFHSLVARRWRRGNVFLLGDAAHQTPPFIGQGMAAGMRDAVNLTWKVAAVVQGRASTAILDTYETERRPHARSVIAQAVLLGKVMRTRLGGRYRDRLVGTVGSLDIVRDFVIDRAFPALKVGPLVRPPGSGPAGHHVPRARVALDGRETNVDDVLGDGFSLLSRETRDGDEGLQVRIRQLSDASGERAWVDVDGTLTAWLGDMGAEAALIRPDRVVMASGAEEAVPRWLEALSSACDWRASGAGRGKGTKARAACAAT